MMFDKSKVYTAVNAEDIPIGSECVFADTFGELQESVGRGVGGMYVAAIDSQYAKYRFIDKANVSWAFAYLIGEPTEPKYCCYDTIDEAFKDIQKHGGWIKHNETGESFYTTVKLRCALRIYGKTINCVDLLNDYVFLDDGTPCGKIK